MDKNNLKTITGLRHKLHQNAELSGQEFSTKKILMEFMRTETDFEVRDCGRWFYCRKDPIAEQTPLSFAPIAFRADMDALPVDETIRLADDSGKDYGSLTPGVSHKCGHDGHSAVLAGVGLELSGKKLKRPVILIFQHAEETGKGGEACARLIPELGIGEVYAFHNLSGYPEGSIVVREGLSQPASKGLTVCFYGRTSHASYPDEGNNPSDAIADLEIFIRGLLKSPHKGMTLCTIVNIRVGTKDFGVSAGEGEISMTLRAEYESEINEMEAEILKEAELLAERDGLRTEHTEADPFPETRNNSEALKNVLSCASNLGDRVIKMKNLWRASEDFGYYLKMCPGAIFYVGNGEQYPPLHTCGYDFNDHILEKPVDLFCALAEKDL